MPSRRRAARAGPSRSRTSSWRTFRAARKRPSSSRARAAAKRVPGPAASSAGLPAPWSPAGRTRR
eukprot:2682098-Alexandrium_andersonii.AAC.1